MYAAISGRSRPQFTSAKIANIAKNRKKRDFSKVDILLCSGRKYDIWPEIGPLDPSKHPETLYWPSYMIWLNLRENQKNRIFQPKNHVKNFFSANLSGRCGPATKSILGIDWPNWCPQIPIILVYPPDPFLLKSSFEISKNLLKIVFFHVFCSIT